MDLFATADLRKRLHIEPNECADVAAPDPLRSWYGHVRQVGRSKFIVLVHAETRFTVVLNAKGVVDVRALHEQWSLAFPQVAATMGLTRDRIAPLLTNALQRVAKADDRRVLGTINDWFRTIQVYGEVGHAIELVQLSCLLNDTPIIGGDIGFPRDRFASFVGSQALKPRDRTMEAPRSGGSWPGTASPEGPKVLHVFPATQALPIARSDPRKGLAHCGEWTITQMPYFADGVLDEGAEPRITIDARGQGQMQFCALTAELDVRVEQRANHVSLTWTWQGDDDGSELCGRGEATVRGDRMTGRIVIHHGDEMTFVATRDR